MIALAIDNDISDPPSATSPDPSASLVAHRFRQQGAEHAHGYESNFIWQDTLIAERSTSLEFTEPQQSTSLAIENTLLTLSPSSTAATSARATRLLKYWANGSAGTGGAFHFIRGIQPALSWEESFNRLHEFAMLPTNWDSYGADPIPADAIAIARELLLALMQPTAWGTMAGFLPSNIVPLADGGLQFEWFGATSQVEVEIGADGKMNCFFAIGRGTSRRSTVLKEAEVQEVIALVSLASGAPVRWRTTSW